MYSKSRLKACTYLPTQHKEGGRANKTLKYFPNLTLITRCVKIFHSPPSPMFVRVAWQHRHCQMIRDPAIKISRKEKRLRLFLSARYLAHKY